MDKLAKQLRDDANNIKCEISPQLDDRIRASLEGMQPDAARPPRRESRSFPLWWASSLTGVAAATAVILLINLREPAPAPVVTEPVPQALQIPLIEWKAQAAVLTSPLEQEYEKLQSDLKKAEEAVKQDIDRMF